MQHQHQPEKGKQQQEGHNNSLSVTSEPAAYLCPVCLCSDRRPYTTDQCPLSQNPSTRLLLYIVCNVGSLTIYTTEYRATNPVPFL